MAGVTPREPQSAADYDDRTTAAVKSVLIEIGQILGSFQGKFAVIGGAVPWLLLDNEDMRHVGSLDVDLSLDAEALGDGEYATLVESLMEHGYKQNKELRRFQLVRSVLPKDGSPPIDVIVDFLMPRDAEIVKNSPPLVANFAVQKADGADLAVRFFQYVAIDGPMPQGGTNKVEIADPGTPCNEGTCAPWSSQTEGRLRHLLLHSKLSRRHRGVGDGLSRTRGRGERSQRLRLYR
jgi:hypothetical protein